MTDTITGQITGLAFGGQGILRHQGLVVFVPFTAPGDLITCRIRKSKKNFANAEIVEILQPGPARIKPACPYFGTCGGCQLQHLNYEAQLDHKRECVQDALNRIGGLSVQVSPVAPAVRQWAYRRHITLTLKPNVHGTFSAGYIATDNRSLLKVEQCPIFADPSDPIIRQVQEVVGHLQCSPVNEGRAALLKQNADKYIVSFHFKEMPPKTAVAFEKALNQNANWAGITLGTPRHFQSFGQTETSFSVDEMTFSFSPGAFIQNHPEQSLKIYHGIRDLAQKSNAETALDLYCGIGVTALLMARDGIHVIGVESNEEAIRQACENAKANKMNQAEFIKDDVKLVLKTLLKKHSPGFVVVNPPREGLEKPVTEILLEQAPSEIVYISCMPSTLARDLKELCREHYAVALCQPYDMFPQTAHVETLVHLKKK